jgi:serine/threonine protein kinase
MRSEKPRPDPPPPGLQGASEDHYPSTRCPESRPPLSSGPLFAGRYEIVEELGRGGMGVVSRARDTRLPRDVAIKVPLHIHGPDSLRRFFKEAEAAAKLDHPHICRILDLGEADGLPYIVLAFIDGKTLAEVVDHRPVDPTRAAKIIRRIARTIQFAHDRGIIHRDLKPTNLMISPHRELIVMDFGLARVEGDDRKTQTGQVFGTLPYMSPEQVQGHAREMGKGCDIYTLGVIFYELLTGRLPFLGPTWEIARQIILVDPIPPSSIDRDLDPELDAIILKAMAKQIPDRFLSMNRFAEAIAAHLRRIGSLSDSGVTPRSVPEPAKPPPPAPVPAKNPERQGVALPVRLRPEPLRERGRRRLKAWDGLVWGSIAILALIGLHTFLTADRPKAKAQATGSRLESEPIAERLRAPARARQASIPTGGVDPDVIRHAPGFDNGSMPVSSNHHPPPGPPRPWMKRRPPPDFPGKSTR